MNKFFKPLASVLFGLIACIVLVSIGTDHAQTLDPEDAFERVSQSPSAEANAPKRLDTVDAESLVFFSPRNPGYTFEVVSKADSSLATQTRDARSTESSNSHYLDYPYQDTPDFPGDQQYKDTHILPHLSPEWKEQKPTQAEDVFSQVGSR